ncbi:MAG: EAL domain-containing protein [Gammaproteobacteria bacterium]|nr:MAG: EAL domain-containing protein [Gammaproteobacteria bacterium]TLZ08485.1 MAG: EAL domain-containing protein [Gammaproteobacteria bacterium]
MPSHPLRITRRVLVVDDNAAIHEDFRKILGGNTESSAELLAAERLLLGEAAPGVARPAFEIDTALQGQEGVARVRHALEEERPYAMAFIDMRMPPGWDGLETILRLWELDPHVQVVICSAHSDYDWTEVVARLDHSDKLLVIKKPFEPIEVLQCANALTRKWDNERTLRRQVEHLEHVVEARTQGLEAANKQLRHLASHDALTGLPNRVLLDDRLSQAVAHAEQDGHSFGVAMFDLDRFKVVNDSLGHRAGDALIKEVAHRLAGVARGTDTVGRLGGDEFLFIMDRLAKREDAEHIARRAVKALELPIRLDGVDLHTSASIGIAMFPADGKSAEGLIANADAAMYCAKQRGRNNIQCYAEGMNSATQERVKLESDLHQALSLKQLELHYQPKVDTKTGLIHGVEALARWRHPQRGLVPPGEFIPLAESCGLIDGIGEWVVRESCRQARAWQLEGLPPLRVAVNLSAFQFRHGNLLQMIREALQAAQLEPRFLEVEITESALMSDPEESVTILEQLSRMGVVVSVDDFGTGYSSMSYLRRFPIDKLKIDRGFIAELISRADDASIVRAIVSLAHSLRLKVVAEGVETSEQLNVLRSLGCDQYQGFCFSPAVPAAQFAALLRESQQKTGPAPDSALDRTYSKLAYRPPRA